MGNLGMGNLVIQCNGSADWRSGPPDSLPEITKLSVECGKQEMTIYLQFSGPYDGSIYSKPNGQSGRCIHVPPHSHITETTFTIEYDDCGTRSDPQGKFYENTIVIQYDDIVIEAWDEAKKIRCEWHDGYEKSAFKMPITISDLDVVEMNFQGDDVDCWLEVQDGKGPWSAKVEGLVPLGSPLTLVVAIQDSEGHFDMRVKSCIAHDGQKHPIHLTDEEGHFYAFKFPETVEVTIQCTVEICRHGCPGTCIEGRDSQPPESDFSLPKSKESDDIPTYKDSFPFSTVITSQDNSDPLDTSPNTNYDFYLNKYPYDLFDDLLVEERQDDKIEYDRHPDKDYADNNDDVYYSQLPNIFNGLKEHGKNFPAAQKIHALSNMTTPEPDLPEATDNPSESPLSTQTDLPTVPNLTDLTTLAIKMGMHTSTTELSTEPNATQIPIASDNSNESLNYQRDDDTVVIKDSGEDHLIQEAFKSTETTNDSVPFGTTDRSGEIFLNSNDYNEANVESRQTDYEFNSNRKRSEEDLLPKKDTELHFEDYKVKARKPFDNYDIRQNYRHRTHKSFLPPAPAPPITLYNGVPLHYYTQSNPNVDYFDEENHPYLSRFPLPKKLCQIKIKTSR
ncbi:ZP domain-containing protein [Caerostris extrusa]|uniref:ZP domain-containing protein n=1 Tax=Caerostris extrusa TaxID=172846 RepID=A0AAV4VF43_CAEEX|nr:ZP domain-containing protein [Caerostris extrusa]